MCSFFPQNGVLPRQRAAITEKASRGSIVEQRLGPDDTRCPFGDRAPPRASHISCHLAGADCVHQDAHSRKLGGELAGQDIECGFRDAIGGRARSHMRERSRFAGKIDDATGLASAQKWEKRLAHRQTPKIFVSGAS